MPRVARVLFAAATAIGALGCGPQTQLQEGASSVQLLQREGFDERTYEWVGEVQCSARTDRGELHDDRSKATATEQCQTILRNKAHDIGGDVVIMRSTESPSWGIVLVADAFKKR